MTAGSRIPPSHGTEEVSVATADEQAMGRKRSSVVIF